MRTTSKRFDFGPWRVVGFYDRRVTVESMSQNKWFRRAAGAALACASIVSIAPLSGPAAPVVSAVSADPGGEFHALTPTRILDTRPGMKINDVQPFGAKLQSADAAVGTAGEFHFNVLGKGGLPEDPDGILAIVANFTVTEPGSQGWVAVYPRGFEFGGANGSSSLINFKAGQSVPNLGMVGLDGNGDLTIKGFGSNTTYHLIIDVVGFISTSQYAGESNGSRLEVVNPGRILDTRITNVPIRAGETRPLQIRGADTISDGSTSIRTDIIPDRDTVAAALVNLTLVNKNLGSQATHVAATPDPITPGAFYPSSSNVPGGGVKANMAVVPVGDDGKIQLFNYAGDLHLVVDVLGYFEQDINADTNRGRIVPLDAPFRAFDTRESEFGDAPLQHGSEEEWSFEAFVDSVVLNPDCVDAETEEPCSVPGPPQQAMIGSLVAVDLQPLHPSHSDGDYRSYLRLVPVDTAAGESSNLNFSLGDVVANMSLVQYGTSGDDDHVVKAYNHYGSIDYLLDVYVIVLA